MVGVSAVAAPTATSLRLADLAVCALIEEAELTPKPALVDRRGGGSHTDMDLPMLRRSAHALHPTFVALAERACGRVPGQLLREELAEIGRHGEAAMLKATGGVNTHRGAIWTLGLLLAAAVMAPPGAAPAQIAALAGRIAAFPDRNAPCEASHGALVERRYNVAGARGEARRGFPNVIGVALPVLRIARKSGCTETQARLDALVALISRMEDTCLLYRGGTTVLSDARSLACAVLSTGGSGTKEGRRALRQLEVALLGHRASPGGCADLLAAALFLDSLDNSQRR